MWNAKCAFFCTNLKFQLKCTLIKGLTYCCTTFVHRFDVIYLTVWLQVDQQMCSAVAFVVLVVVTAVGRQLFVLVEVVGILLVQPG